MTFVHGRNIKEHNKSFFKKIFKKAGTKEKLFTTLPSKFFRKCVSAKIISQNWLRCYSVRMVNLCGARYVNESVNNSFYIIRAPQFAGFFIPHTDNIIEIITMAFKMNCC